MTATTNEDITEIFRYFGSSGSLFPFCELAAVLEAKLRCRPDRQRLLDSNIIQAASPTVAPALASSIVAMNRRRAADGLQRKLRRRRSREELYSMGVLHADESFVAPSLHAAQSQLRFSHKQRVLREKLTSRPSKQKLVDDNIVHDGSPQVDRILRKLERKQTISRIEAQLTRPRLSNPPAFLIEIISEADGY